MKICPRCGSRNVDWIIPQNWSIWVCKDCDYTGPIIEGNEQIAEEIRKDYEAKLRKEKARKKRASENKEKDENEDNEEENTEENNEEEDLTDEELEKQLEELNI